MNQQTVVLNNLYESLELTKAMYLPFRIKNEESITSMDVENVNFLLSTKSDNIPKLDEIKIINFLLSADQLKIGSANLMRSFEKILYEKSSFLCWIHARAYLRENKFVEAKELLIKAIGINNSVYQYYDDMSKLLFFTLEYKESFFYRKYSTLGNYLYYFNLWDKDNNTIKTMFQHDSNYMIYSYCNHYYLVKNTNTIKIFNGKVYEFKKNIFNSFIYKIIKYIQLILNNLTFFLIFMKLSTFKFSKAFFKLKAINSFTNLTFCKYLAINVNYVCMFFPKFIYKIKKNNTRYEYIKSKKLYNSFFKEFQLKPAKKYTFDEIVKYIDKLDRNAQHG